jgi:hypothetical protein
MDTFVIRLWQRVGKVRALAVLVLVAGLAGGLLIANRQTQHNATAEPVKAADAASLPRTSGSPSAGQASEQASAQSKAQDAASAAAAQAKAAEDAARKKKEEEASRSNTRAPYPAPASCGVYTGNRNIGCTEMVAAGFALDQMPCLDKLWTKESGWNPKAHNKSSGAHGIPQALPGDQMAAYGSEWETDAKTQIKWGLSYIKRRYKTPCGAWAHSQSSGWY